MKRSRFLVPLAALTAVVVISAGCASGGSEAASTTTRKATTTTVKRTTTTTRPTTTRPPTTTTTVLPPEARAALPTALFASGEVVVPQGAPGALEVVLEGRHPYGDRSTFGAVAVWNGTGSTVRGVEVNITARDAAGRLIGSEVAKGIPEYLEPGNFGLYTFGFDRLSDGVTFEYQISSVPGSSSFASRADLQAVEASVLPGRSGEKVVMLFQNDTGRSRGPANGRIVCFSADGMRIVNSNLFPGPPLGPGESGSATSLGDLDGPCPIVVVGAHAS